ncbi:MAG TPA: hypothetical protein VJH70_02290 [Candidatus Paceibacterota bacterium]
MEIIKIIGEFRVVRFKDCNLKNPQVEVLKKDSFTSNEILLHFPLEKNKIQTTSQKRRIALDDPKLRRAQEISPETLLKSMTI